MKPELVGVWQLSGYAYVDTQVGVSGDIPPDAEVEKWLCAAADGGWPALQPQTGLELVIRPDRSYSERVTAGELHLLWYDSEGVQVGSPEPSEGTVRDLPDLRGASLHPRNLPDRETRTGEGARDILRYDDGDTLVSDIVCPAGDSLVRVVSVVTDDVYFNRIVARYGRTPD